MLRQTESCGPHASMRAQLWLNYAAVKDDKPFVFLVTKPVAERSVNGNMN